METSNNFLTRNKAYLLIGLAFIALTYWYFFIATIAEVDYIYKFILEILKGNISGQIVPFDTLNHYEQKEVGLFGPNYTSIAPEVIRAYEERTRLLPIVFLVEFIAFAIAFFVSGGRKKATIQNPENTILVYSLFQRIILLLNIIIIFYLFITGFSITFGEYIGGGTIHRYMRMTHELVGVLWIPVWFLVTIIAFKDHKLFVRPSNKIFYKVFLKGSYHPMERISYLAFVIFGFMLVVSGFLIWFMHPNFHTHVETIQFKRLMLFVHFMGSAILTFFLYETVYAAFVSVKGYIPSLFTGKLPKEYLEQIRPDLLEK
jgi:formate dehydrogenase subunit gamma